MGGTTNAAIRNNVIVSNVAEHGGGGVWQCAGMIENNIIAGNRSERGGTIYGKHYGYPMFGFPSAEFDVTYTAIRNNTIVGNSAQHGGGLYACHGVIHNCIIWGNAAPNRPQLRSSSNPAYCCIQDWTGSGEGNFPCHPYFVDATNADYHLKSWSPCIDAGDPTSPFSNEPEPNGGRINMRAYGNTPEAASRSPDIDNDGLPDDWEMEVFGDLTQHGGDDPDADLVPNIDEYRFGSDPRNPPAVWYVDGSVNASGGGTSWETAFKMIQGGIDAASDKDTVVVAEGIYVGNIYFKGKNIALHSTDPLNAAVVANTTIDGNKLASVVAFVGTEKESCVLSGFTIRNGSGEDGGGILGGTRDNPTDATICNNRIIDNSAEDHGGGLAFCNGRVHNNLMVSNAAAGVGGGAAHCHGVIENNLIAGNSCAAHGAGLSDCDGVVLNNTVCGNFSHWGGHRWHLFGAGPHGRARTAESTPVSVLGVSRERIQPGGADG